MISLLSIPLHLQVTITDKLDYFDQQELELSSKHGKELASLRQYTAVLAVQEICFYRDEAYFRIKPPMMWKKWSNLREISNLPRFLVHQVAVQDISEKATFVQNNVCLKWRNAEARNPAVLIKLSEILHITKIYMQFLSSSVFSPLFYSPKIEFMSIGIDDISDELLLQIKCSTLVFKSDTNSIATTANLFLQQWYKKERIIKWFQLYGSSYTAAQNDSFYLEALLLEIPFSTIWKFESNLGITEYKILKSIHGQKEYREMNENDSFYSINRGDKKLLVSVRKNTVYAQEYTNLEDVLDIRRRGVKRKRSKSPNLMIDACSSQLTS